MSDPSDQKTGPVQTSVTNESCCAGTAVLIMAGGRSARMRAGSCSTHKSLRTVQGSPLLAWNLAYVLSFGFQSIFVARHAREHDLAKWLDEHGTDLVAAAGGDLEQIVEDTPLGTIGAVARVPAEMQHVLVINVDNLTDLPLDAFLQHHLASRAAATLAAHEETVRIPFGRLVISSGHVEQYDEKPDLSFTVCSGTSVFARRGIPCVGAGALALPDLISQLLSAGETVSAFRHRSRWIDVNDEAALREAEAMVHAEGTPWPGQHLLGNVHA